jgi:stalled ribosome rescue protein Dom34
MRLIFKKLEKDSSGELKMLPEDPEDMWHVSVSLFHS